MSDLTPDQLVSAIFRECQRQCPGSDPGDLFITVQDDMPLVTVEQSHWVERIDQLTLTMGGSIQEALEKHLLRVAGDQDWYREGC